MPEVTVPLTGGLELRRSKRAAAPGSLLYCKNFEVNRFDGYAKTSGFVRYDGRHVLVEPGDYFRITATDATQYSWTVGSVIGLGSSATGIICNFSSVLSGGNYIHTFVVKLISSGYGIIPIVGGIATTYTASPEYLTIGSVERLDVGETTASREAEINALETAYNGLVGKVPGGPYTKIPGVTVFRNKLYVVADYRNILVSSGTYANIDPLEGDLLRKSDGSEIGNIVQFTPISGDWGAGTGFGYFVVDTAGYDDVTLNTYSQHITNSEFSGDTSMWISEDSAWAFPSNNAVTSTANKTLSQTIIAPVASGDSYSISFNVNNNAGGSTLTVDFYQDASLVQNVYNAVPTGGGAVVSLSGLMTGAANRIVFTVTTLVTTGFEIDNVGLTVLDGIHVYRSSTAYDIGLYRQDLTGASRAGILTCGYQNDGDWIYDSGGTPLAFGLNRWSRVTLGRSIPYVGGQDGNAPIAYVRPGYVADNTTTPVTTSTTTPDGFATTCTSQSSGWLDSVTGMGAPLAAGTGDNANYVYNSAATILLPDINFGFDLSEIPDGATITGIQFTVVRRSTVAAQQIDEVVTLNGVSGGVNNYAKTTAWGNTMTSHVYGSSVDTWGNPLQTSQVKSAGFGLRIQVRTITGTPQAEIQKVQIAVTYKPQSTKAYLWNGATDVEVTIIHHTITSGAFDSGNDAAGQLIVDGLVPDSEKTALLGAGLQIRSGPSGGGNLIATTAGKDVPITLPDSSQVYAAAKRYQFSEARPYASDDNEVLFITNGVEPGMMFDGTYGLSISTGLEAEFEKPTHAAYWGNNLFLGYDTGSVQVSDTGSPLTYIGAGSAALEIGVGDFITGLMPLKGQALAVSTRNRIYAIYGRVAEEFTLEIVSPVVGSVSYSAIDVGRPIFADYQGVSTVNETDRYGNFAAGRLSESVSPWLNPRLQVDTASLGRFVGALQNRENSQYRMFFADGWVLTGTLKDDGMQFTTQHLKVTSDSDDIGVRVLGLTSGVFDDGKEGSFFTIDNATKGETDFLGLSYAERNRYVYKLGCGRKFDGQAMQCSLITGFNHMGDVIRWKKFDRATFFADGYYSDVEVHFGVAAESAEYDTFDIYADLPSQGMGGATSQMLSFIPTTARPDPTGMMRTAEIAADGYALNLGITLSDDSIGNGLAPITFQDVTVRFNAIDKTKA